MTSKAAAIAALRIHRVLVTPFTSLSFGTQPKCSITQQLVPILVIAGKRIQLIQHLSIAIQQLQVMNHSSGLRRLRGMIPIRHSQVSPSPNQQHHRQRHRGKWPHMGPRSIRKPGAQPRQSACKPAGRRGCALSRMRAFIRVIKYGLGSGASHVSSSAMVAFNAASSARQCAHSAK